MTTYLNITQLANKAKGNLDAVTRRFVFGMFARIIMRSPVDTGRFRANWTLGFGAPAGTTNDSIDKGPVNQTGSGQSTTKSLVQAGLSGTNWIGSKVYLTNSLHYAWFLEYGRMYKRGYGPGSRQAPLGMVRLTVNEYAEVLGQSMPYNLNEFGA